jgi:glycylpeptide N-tetradecanoyltransferase
MAVPNELNGKDMGSCKRDATAPPPHLKVVSCLLKLRHDHNNSGTTSRPRTSPRTLHTMPQENSKVSEPDATAQAAAEDVAESSKPNVAAESADESEEEAGAVEGSGEKKSRKRKIKDALTGKGKAPEITSTESPAGGHLSKDQMNELLESNPALKQELLAKSKGPKDLEQMIRKLNINEMLTGLAPGGKNTKDMASHAFWKTQPVPSFDEMANKEKIQDGPIKEVKMEEVDKNPSPMYPGFEWVTMDLEDEKQLEEVYDLLTNHYVEDKDATFRFRYSPSFLNWYSRLP